MITSVQVDAVTLAPSMVLGDVVITHGRSDVLDGPAASQAVIVFEQPEDAGMPPWGVGSVLTLAHDNAVPGFAGRITDLSLTHMEQPAGAMVGRLVVAASGTVAALGNRHVGDDPWPAESGSDRAGRILGLAGVTWQIDGAADGIILPRDVDSRTALDLLGDLVKSTAAAVFDTPDGTVVYQPMAKRARPVYPFRWMDWPPGLEWQQIDPALTWEGIGAWHSADSEFPLVIPAAAVEWEPDWRTSEADVINHARIGYGTAEGEQDWQEVIDAASVTEHGKRYTYVGTQLQNMADALAYATWIVTTRARAHWSLGTVVVALDALDGATRDTALRLTCGDHVTIPGMPQPAPALVAEGIVEGWTFEQTGAGGQIVESLTLVLSSLLESLAVMQWQDYPPAYLWPDHPAYLTWADLVSVQALGA